MIYHIVCQWFYWPVVLLVILGSLHASGYFSFNPDLSWTLPPSQSVTTTGGEKWCFFLPPKVSPNQAEIFWEQSLLRKNLGEELSTFCCWQIPMFFLEEVQSTIWWMIYASWISQLVTTDDSKKNDISYKLIHFDSRETWTAQKELVKTCLLQTTDLSTKYDVKIGHFNRQLSVVTRWYIKHSWQQIFCNISLYNQITCFPLIWPDHTQMTLTFFQAACWRKWLIIGMFDHREPAIFFWILHLTGEDHPPKKIQDPVFDTMVVGMFGLKILPLKMIEKEQKKYSCEVKVVRVLQFFVGDAELKVALNLIFSA